MPRGNKPKIFLHEGQVFGRGRVTVPEHRIAQTSTDHKTRRAALRLCDPGLGGCGNEYSALITELMRGYVTNCGCGGVPWEEQLVRSQIRAVAAAAGYRVSNVGLHKREES